MDEKALPSWNDGAARAAILDFVARVTEEGGPDFVPAPERVAVVDNDGTLWCEKPTYTQVLFLQAELEAKADRDPELAADPIVAALLQGDLQTATRHGLGPVVQALLGIHEGLTVEEFAAAAAAWFETARHPRFDRPVTQLAYVPMVELLDLLRAQGFKVFIVTGGGVEFVRAASDRLYGVTPDDVVGSAVEVDFARRDGRADLVRTAKLLGSPNEGAPKVVNIQAHVGQRPILAIGNSAGDREMLEYATTGPRPSLGLVIDHDDEEREYAYEGKAMTDPDAEAIADTAARAGWTVVSMRRDWARVFP
jgi:phosphoglycolate phosphatase-like HAD superfamily hydrolase